MLPVRSKEPVRIFGAAIGGLLAFTVAALGVTIWVMVDFLREQTIVAQLLNELPSEFRPEAVLLAGELRWQFRLSILVVLNLLTTGFALVILWRAYKLSQEDLRDLRALASDILNSVDQAVITADLDGRISSVNRRGMELFEANAEVVGEPISRLSKSIPLDEFRLHAMEQDTSRLMRDFAYCGIGADRAPRILRAYCDPLRSHADEAIGCIIQLRDVTERTFIEERMHRMERYLGLGSLAVGLHHEIKNPLAALSLHVQLLEEELEGRGLESEESEMLGVIKKEVMRIGVVLESFRDFTSLGKLQISRVDLVELISRQIKLLSPQAKLSHVKISFDKPSQPLQEVDVDVVRIEQVLMNLIMNAMQAMSSGGDLKIKASEVEVDGHPRFKIEVEDNGPGIPEDLLHRIFDPYFTTKGDGTGMGLAICEKIIRQHEGTLDVSSSVSGSLFTITLPIHSRTHAGRNGNA